MQSTDDRPPVAQLVPPEIRDALVRAGLDRDQARIDMLTDNLVVRGYCRPRHTDSGQAPKNRWEQGA